MTAPSALPSVELLVAAMHCAEPPDLLVDFPDGVERPDVLVINQCPDGPLPVPLEQPHLRMISVDDRGLAKSRNLALDSAQGDLVVLADADLRYLPSALQTLRAAFAAHPDATVITFQFLNSDTGQPYKRYAKRGFRHNLRTIASVSSVEIAVRRSKLGALRFDPAHGLGARFPSAEEGVFLADVLRAGHAAYYWPEPLCSHPGQTSGHTQWSAQVAEAKGAAFRRMYRGVWPLVTAWFVVRKYPLYKAKLGLAAFAWHSLRGVRAVRRSET